MKTMGETSAPRNTGPEPMQLGVACKHTLTKEEYQKLHAKNACFYCLHPNVGHVARDCPLKKNGWEMGEVSDSDRQG